MKLRTLRDRFLQQEDLNFLLTNRVPRIALTRFMGWFSGIRQPLVREASMAGWRAFTVTPLDSPSRSASSKVKLTCASLLWA